MAEVGGLLIDIGMNVAGLREDMKKSNRELNRGTNRMNRQLGKLRKNVGFVTNAMKGMVGVFSAGALARGISNSLRSLEEMNRQAESLGASAETIQELTFTFQEFGLQQDDVADALATITDRARDAEAGMQSYIDDFGLLGIEVDDLRGKSPGELFRVMARAMAETEDAGDRTTAMVRIFGDDLGRRLNPLLMQGEEGLRNYAQAAREAGAVIDDALVDKGAEAAAEMRKLRLTMGAQFTSAVAENAEAISSLGEALSGLVGLLGKAVQGYLNLGKVAAQIMLPPELTDQLDDVNQRISRLLENRERMQQRLGTGPEALSEIDQQIKEARAERQRLMTAVDLMRRGENAPDLGGEFPLPGGTTGGSSGRSQRDDGLSKITVNAARNLQSEMDQLKPFESLVNQGKQASNKIGSEFEDLSQSIGRAFEDSFADWMLGVETNFGDLLRRMAAQAAASRIFSLLGSMGGPVGGFFSSFFGGARAQGGDVEPGKSYLVGEKGPELVSFGRKGHVTPNDEMGGATIQITNNIQTGLPAQVVGELDTIGRQAGAQAAASMMGEMSRRRPSHA